MGLSDTSTESRGSPLVKYPQQLVGINLEASLAKNLTPIQQA